MITRNIKLYGTEEPVSEQRLLVAGPVSATLQDGQLRWIKVGNTEVIRGIAFLVRDRHWSTCDPKISNLEVEQSDAGFRVTFDAHCATPDGDIPWHADFGGSADGTIRCEGIAHPATDAVTCRTGFVILHPLDGFTGRPITIEHVDGSLEQTVVPDVIDPAQPFKEVRAMTHEPDPGLRVTIRMEGDSWETEDHRNWTDASFKTYCRPLALEWPYTIPGGSEVRQVVTLSFAGTIPAAAAEPGPRVTMRVGAPVGPPMPSVGLSVLPEDAGLALAAADLVRVAAPRHLNVRMDLRSKDWAAPLRPYRQLGDALGVPLIIEAIIPGEGHAAAEIRQLAQAIRSAGISPAAVVVSPAADLKSYPPGTPFPPGVASWKVLAAATRAEFPGVRVGGGMLSNFTELNRKRPPGGLFDFITHATSSLVHAADDDSTMETLESISHIIGSTGALFGDVPYRLGPSHIGNSFNPYGAAVSPNPQGGRVTMARQEPRHGALFGAAWHLGFLSQAATGGVEAVTVASPAGAFGIVRLAEEGERPGSEAASAGRLHPVFHVIRGLAAAAGAARLDTHSSDTRRLRGIAFDRNGPELWLANLGREPLQVRLEGLPDEALCCWVLDEDRFEAARRDPDDSDRGVPLAGTTLNLPAYAIARVTRRN